MKNRQDTINTLTLPLYWVFFVLFLALTFGTWLHFYQKEQSKLSQTFERKSKNLITQIRKRMSYYESALHSGASFFHALNFDVNVHEWNKFATTLISNPRYKGISGIGFINNINLDEKENFIKEQKKLRPYFNIHPQHQKNTLWPITFIVPENTNLEAVGLDIAFEKNRFKAAEQARDSGLTQISGPISLVQEKTTNSGFLIYLPVYSKANINTISARKQHFVGHIYIPFTLRNLLEKLPDIDTQLLSFSIFDEETALINELNSGTHNFDPSPLFTKSIKINMYERDWDFTISSNLELRKNSQHHFLLTTLGIIIILNGLLLLYLIKNKANKKLIEIQEKLQKKIVVNDEYYQFITDALPCGIITMNREGIIERANQTACTLFAYASNEINKKSIIDLLPSISSQSIPNLIKIQEQNQSTNSDLTIDAKTKKNKIFPVEAVLTASDINGEHKVIATIVDMREKSKIINELKRSNEELDSFAYIASHDLKAPLRGIVQLSDWIIEDIGHNKMADVLHNLGMLKTRALRLEHLLADLLEYSRAGKIQGESSIVNIKAMLLDIFELLNPPSTFSLEIETTIDTIETIHMPLHLIFRNLMDNAIKHHDKETGIINIKISEHTDNYEFIFSDNGPGIKTEFQEQVFEVFRTLKPRDEVEGSGMGLSIIKKTLAHYEQDIRLISDGKSGCTFVFNWPKHLGDNNEQ